MATASDTPVERYTLYFRAAVGGQKKENGRMQSNPSLSYHTQSAMPLI
jgi:hypothetical protein